MKTLKIVLLLSVLFLVAACTTEEATPPPSPTDEPEAEAQTDANDEASGVIVFGDVDADDPVGKIEEFQPIVDYLAENLSDAGIGSGEVTIAPDVETMISLVEAGDIDLYYDSLYPSLIVANATGAKPLVLGWRGGEPVYRSVFFALPDSGITSVEDLNGKIVAYDDITSTSGYMMPTAYLLANELNPVEKRSAQSSVADDEIGYIFSGDDENTIEWVLSGRVDAGVVDNLTYLDDIPEDTRENLVIVAETEDVPRRVMMIGPDVDEETAAALAEALIAMDQSEEGLELLAIVKTAKFEEFEGGADTAFEPILEMFEIIQDQ